MLTNDLRHLVSAALIRDLKRSRRGKAKTGRGNRGWVILLGAKQWLGWGRVEWLKTAIRRRCFGELPTHTLWHADSIVNWIAISGLVGQIEEKAPKRRLPTPPSFCFMQPCLSASVSLCLDATLPFCLPTYVSLPLFLLTFTSHCLRFSLDSSLSSCLPASAVLTYGRAGQSPGASRP